MTTDNDNTTILIVEDERPLADLYVKFLEPNYTVHTAYDGAEALERMSTEVDVVLLDRRMPNVSGEEVLETIRDEGYDCRVAMVTAVTPDVDIIEMGFDDYLTKPVKRPELLETVDNLLALDAYDELMESYYRLTAKKAALEVEKTDTDLAEYEEFDRLTEQLAELEDQLEENREKTSGFDIRSILDRPGSIPGDE